MTRGINLITCKLIPISDHSFTYGEKNRNIKKTLQQTTFLPFLQAHLKPKNLILPIASLNLPDVHPGYTQTIPVPSVR